MARIDVNLLTDRENQYKQNEGSGAKTVLPQQKIDKEVLMRLCPTSPKLGGMPYLEVITYWLNKKVPLVCLSTFGNASVIEEEIEAAIKSGNKTAIALVRNEDIIKRQVSWRMPFWELKDNGADAEPTPMPEPRILEFTAKLRKDIVKLITSRPAQNKTEDGLMDRVKGYNIVISRDDSKTPIAYDAVLAEQMEMPESFYENILCPYTYSKFLVKHPDMQRAMIRELLYGEPIPAAAKKKQDAWEAKNKEEFKEYMASLKIQDAPAAKKPGKAKPAPVEDDEDETPFEVEDELENQDLDKALADGAKRQAAKSGKKRSIADDIASSAADDEDFEFEDDEPKKPAKKTTTRKQVEDDDFSFD